MSILELGKNEMCSKYISVILLIFLQVAEFMQLF